MRVEQIHAHLPISNLFRRSGGGITPSVETVDHTADINELLLPGEERMALRADINVHVALGGMRLHDGTAGALDRGFFIFGMDSGLHGFYLFAVILLIDYSTLLYKMQHFF